MNAQPDVPSVGQIVAVRQRRYLVEQYVPPVKAGDSTLVRLACVDDDAQGQSLEILWEKELDRQILSGEAWDSIATRGFDPPRKFAAYFHTLRWNCVTSTDPNLLQSPFRAGIRLDAYELEPLRKALRLPRVNLFIADDVGLGKTIEAGLIARELLLRKKIREIVVACPPSMLLQWQEELENRFGLPFEILDRDYLHEVRKERGFGINPWTTHPRFLVSHRLLIDEAYAGSLRDWLGTFKPGSLLILDEAHHAAPSSGQRYAIDSHITRAIRDLAPRFEHRLFLSATPHNGHSNSFSALLEILDPQRFCRGVKVSKKMLDDVMVRRLKDDLRQIAGGFPVRKVIQKDIDGLPDDAPELRLASLLDEYRVSREQRLSAESRRVQTASGILICGLQQRLFSSVEAFARTLRVHRKTVRRQWEAAQAGKSRTPTLAPRADLLLGGIGSDDDRAALPEQEIAVEEEAQIAAVSEATVGPSDTASSRDLFEREQQLLDQMTEIAEAARALPDARVQKLISWIRENMCPNLPSPGAKWNDTRVIVFTEWEDTRRYLQQQISAAIADTDRASERLAVYSGSTPVKKKEGDDSGPLDRESIKTAFNTEPARHPLRILIATDAAREGLNLQAHCWHLFHFDVPWNPSRMEQRNGRVDRKLQPNPEVYCYYFFYKQRPEDRILAALVRKTKTIREELGSLSQVIDSRLDTLMKDGIRRKKINALELEIDSADLEKEQRQTVEEELESNRERQENLRKQLDRLRDLLASSQKATGLTQDRFRSAISSALEILGAEPLKASDHGKAGEPTPYVFPPIDQRAGADPSWADTMDSLRTPRPRDQKFWEWRRTSPIRPVVFQDPGVVTEEVVQLHLEQRVVQRLLGRFTAQGFVYHDLSRACLAQSSDPIPRVILVGRLALYGPGAARLHEELVPVTARWIDTMVRKGPLAPYGRETETLTLALLDEALLNAGARRIPDPVVRQLQAAAPRDIQELLPHLQTRCAKFIEDAKLRLEKRAETEAKQMLEILETQKKHLSETVARYERPEAQLKFQEFNEEERRQLESNQRYWGRRLSDLDKELRTEPDRIRNLYKVRAQRIEPIGLVYLWPVTG
jgi:SNF2 family DNA or RNA helicase